MPSPLPPDRQADAKPQPRPKPSSAPSAQAKPPPSKPKPPQPASRPQARQARIASAGRKSRLPVLHADAARRLRHRRGPHRSRACCIPVPAPPAQGASMSFLDQTQGRHRLPAGRLSRAADDDADRQESDAGVPGRDRRARRQIRRCAGADLRPRALELSRARRTREPLRALGARARISPRARRSAC